MCDCFHLAFPNWHAASSETGGGRRLRGAEPVPEDNSICDEPSQFTEGERPRPQGSSPVEEYPEMEKYMDSDKECEADHDPHRKSGGGKKSKKSGLGSMFEKRSTLKTHKLKEAHSPESEVIVKTAQDGCAEGLIYGGGGREGIFIKEVVPESPASKNLKLKEGDQVLSATVYFDNVTYDDAMQILGHAQAYKVKLCLKRKPDITETEPIIESDVIPEDETYVPEMREKGKTKRRSEARISWPKFHTLGKKSQFTRSHSSSEADEQRKLELSPTTSDTESPIKSQDALKGKKKHKMKLSFLKKRGRVSSSEDQDIDTATTGEISGKIQTETSDMISPEILESPSGEDLKVSCEDLHNEQKLIHKMELITIDSTLKTEDLTVALADQGSPSGTKSPDGKKKKKERSELKMKILGKDKSHKKEAKSKASPKRLKTLGASLEIADQPETEKSNAVPSLETHKEQQGDQQPSDAKAMQVELDVPKVELEISDVVSVKRSPKKDEKAKKAKDSKQKHETKIFKLPKIGFGDIAIEEEIQKTNANVEEGTSKIEAPTEGTDVKEDPYERLSKGKTQLPKREDIEIPGMEDFSGKITGKGMKQHKAVYTEHNDEVSSETIPLSIDVDSVKEAVSKLPGYKLPKVDTSGVPIPEEITVIDANAQRISVKTPTKVVDTKTKHETHFTKFDTTYSSSITKTTMKLPKFTPDELTSEVLVIETRVEKRDKMEDKQSGKETEVYKREDIIIPGKESAEGVDDKKSKKTKKTASGFGITMPDIGIDFPKQSISQQKDDNIKEERTIFLQDEQTSKTDKEKAIGLIGGLMSDFKTPDIDGIEFIDSVSEPLTENDSGPKLAGFSVNLDTAMPNADISFPEITSEVKDAEAKGHISIGINIDGAEIKKTEKGGHGSKFKIPNLGISMPKVKGPKIDMGLTRQDGDARLPGAKTEVKDVPQVEVALGKVDVSIPAQKIEVEKPELEIKTQQAEYKLDGQGNKIKFPEFSGIKMPKLKGPQFDLSLSKKDTDVKLPEANVEVKLPEAPEIDAKLGDIVVSIPEQKVEVKKPDMEIKPLEGELDGHGGKIKMPKFGLTMPKIEGPDINLSFSKKDTDVTLPKAKAEVEIPEVPKVSVDIKSSQIEADIDGQGNKVKKLGISMPKVKLPEIDFHLSKKDTDVKPSEVQADVQLPDAELEETSAKVDIKLAKSKSAEKNLEGSPLKFKMPSIKIPKLGVATPNAGVEITKKSKSIPTPETQLKPLEEGVALDITAPSVDIEGPSVEVKKAQAELDGKGQKFKLPKFGISVPKVKGPEIDFSLPQRDVDVPEVKAGVKLPEAEFAEPDIKVEFKAPEINVQQQDFEGSSSKFKMPTFKLPKLGFDAPNVSLEARDMDKEVKIEGPELTIPTDGLAVDITAPSIKTEGPSIDIQTTETKLDGKGGKFKMPGLGFSMPKAKGPKLDFSLSKKDVEVKLPATEAGVKLPEVDLGKVDVSIPEIKGEFPEAKVKVQLPETTELNVEMKPAELEADGKFKMPKFGINLPKVKGPDIDFSLSRKDIDVKLPQTDIEAKLPDAPKIDISLGKADVAIPEAKVQVKPLEVDVKALETDDESQSGKFKMPKFGITMPKVKGPEFDISFSKKDAEVTLPEANVEVNLPDVDLKKPSADVEASPSRFKLPSLKMPTFGAATQKGSADGPDMDIHVEGAELKIPTDGITHDIAAQNVDFEGPSLDVKIPETEGVGKEGKFKMPKFGISLPKVQGPKFGVTSPKKGVDVKLPEAPEIDVTLGKVDVSIPEATIEVEKPQMDVKPLQSEGEITGPESKFKMPKFGISVPKVKGPEFDFSLSKKAEDNAQPDIKAEFTLPDVELKDQPSKVEIKGPEIEVQPGSIKASPSKFKMPAFKFPKFGVATPNVSMEVPDMDREIKIDGADMQISVPSADIDVPKVEAEVHLPEVEVKETSGGVVIDQPPGVDVDVKLKKPKFSLPSFSFSKPSVKAPEIDASLQDVNVAIPEGKVNVKGGEMDIKLPEGELKVDSEDSKFKLPKFGISMPKVTGPDIDLSLSKKDVDITLPEAKADVELKGPSAELEITGPELKLAKKDTEGSPSKYKMPTFKLPKFGVGMPSAIAEVPETKKDLKINDTDIHIPEEVLTVDIKGPSIDVKMTETEHEGKESKFKLPKFGISMPKVKGPDIDLSLSKKDIEVTLPEGKAEVTLPDTKMKKPSAEVEVKSPEIKIATRDKEDSPSKFKLPTFKLPKFGVSTPSASVELQQTDRDIKIDGADIKIPEEVLTVTAPSVDIKGPSMEITTTETEIEGKGSRFKMPSLGFKRPSIDVSLSKKDGSVTLPEATAEVKLPEVEVNTEGSPSKYKMPTFKIPKFGVGTPSATVEVPETNKDIKIEGADIKSPEKSLKVTAPSVDIKGPTMEITTTETEIEGKGSRFKMPSLGFKRPSIDVSLSKKDGSVTLPEATAEVKLPEVEVNTEGSPSKYKMPTFKIPKYGVGTPSATVEVPETNIDVKIDGADIKSPEKSLKVTAPSVDIKGPSMEITTTETDIEGKGSRFKMPSLGFKRPSIDVSLSKKDGSVTLPEATAEVKLPEVEVNTEGSPSKYKMPTFKIPKFGVGTPSATVEVPETNIDVKIDGADIKSPEKSLKVTAPSVDIKGPSMEITTTETEIEGKGSRFKMPSLGFKRPSIDVSLSKKDGSVTLPEATAEVKLPEVEVNTEGSPSKYKMPTFKIPKFGVGTPSATVEVPETNIDVKIDGADIKSPEKSLKVTAPSVDIKGPSMETTTTETEMEGKGSKFKMPSLGFKRPSIDVSLSKKDVEVKLPEGKAEVKLPDIEMKKPSAEVEVKSPEIKIATRDKEDSPSKFKLPTFKLPKFGVSTPSASVELQQTDKDIKIDGGEIKFPEEVLTVTAPSVDIKGPSIDITTTETEIEGKGSRFKMPSLGFKRPSIDVSLSKKDGSVTLPEATAEVKLPEVKLKEPSADLEIKAPEIKVTTKGTEGSPSKYKMPTFKLPKFGVGMPSATVEVSELNKDLNTDGLDIKIPEEVLKVVAAAPSVDIKGPSMEITTTETEIEGKGSRFKMPSLGFKRPSGDLSISKKDVDVTLPEVKAEVKLPEVKLTQPSAEVEVKAPEIKMTTTNTEGSPSKYKMPTFKLPKFGVSMPSSTVEVSELNKDLKIDGADIKIPEEVLTIGMEGPSIDVKTTGPEHEGKGSTFKMPKLSVSIPTVKGPEIDVSKDVIVTQPEAKVEVKLPEVDLKKPSAEVEIKAPEIKVQTKDKESSPSKFKLPTFKLPKFGVSTPSATVQLQETDIKIDGADIKIPEEVLTVTAPSVDIKGPSMEIPTESEQEGKGSKFKMPSLGFSVPPVKQPDTDLSLSKTDVDVELREAKVDVQTSNIEGSPSKFKMPSFKLPKFGAASAQVSVEVPDIDRSIKTDGEKLENLSVDLKVKESETEGSGGKFKLPSLGISMPKVKGPEIDVSLSKIDEDVALPEAKAEVKLPEVEVKVTKDDAAVPDVPTVEVEDKMRRPSWTFPKFSFSRSGAKAPDVDVSFETPEIDVASEETKKVDLCPPDVEVQGPSAAISTEEQPAVETDANLKKYKFSLPRLSFSKSSVKELEVSTEQPHLEVSLPEGEVIVTQPGMKNKTELRIEHGEPGSKFKLPKFDVAVPKVKGATDEIYVSQKDVEIKLPDVKAEVKLPEIEVKSSFEAKANDAAGSPMKVKGPSVEVKTDAGTPTEIENLGSPSKFRLPSFKMPKLSFSKPKTEDQYIPVETEGQEDYLEIKIEPREEGKSPKMTLTSFGEILKNIDVEFNVPKSDSTEEVVKIDGKQKEAETPTKQDVTKSPERTGWFKFPRFGLSSPSEPEKILEKDQEKSPEGETADETVSPTCSVESSDAFADISSAMTSENVGLSLSSPTKVTVKYSDPTNTATGLGEVQSNIITSTTRTELISIEPNLPEKITILSSGVSSSSEDTLRLESGKIHVITSNIEATPESQHAKLLTTLQVQSVGGSPLKSDGDEAASWTVEDSQGTKKTVFERRLVTETSSERSESRETIVITKQITRMLDTAEHISGETASSVKRLKETVHSEKMRFFDEAEK